MKKFIVLGVLFLLPLVAYLFFASGVHNFAKLPILEKEVGVPLDRFETLNSKQISLADKITIVGFLGSDLEATQAAGFNLNQKIYKKNHEFQDFQILYLLPFGTEQKAQKMLDEMNAITDMSEWHFAFGTPERIQAFFTSLQTPYKLNANLATPYVFIVDKDQHLRGRDGQDKDEDQYYGYDTRSVAELNNVMTDDIKVILAEYRLALKKYKADRKN